MHQQSSIAGSFTCVAALSCVATTLTLHAADADWKANTISPVTNPLYFEGPQIGSEIRPVFLYHNLGKDLGTSGGDVQVLSLIHI